MTQKNLFSDYQKEMMAEYLQNQYDLYFNLWKRASDLYIRQAYGSDRDFNAFGLMKSFRSKMNYISKLQCEIYM